MKYLLIGIILLFSIMNLSCTGEQEVKSDVEIRNEESERTIKKNLLPTSAINIVELGNGWFIFELPNVGTFLYKYKRSSNYAGYLMQIRKEDDNLTEQ